MGLRVRPSAGEHHGALRRTGSSPLSLAHHLERSERRRIGARCVDEADADDRQGNSEDDQDADQHDDRDHRRRQHCSDPRTVAGHASIIAGSGAKPPPPCRTPSAPGHNRRRGCSPMGRRRRPDRHPRRVRWPRLHLSSRIEPHWVAKDQSRFLTVAEELDQHGIRIGRKRDVRVHIDEESEALLAQPTLVPPAEFGGVDHQVEVDNQPQPQRLRAAPGFADH